MELIVRTMEYDSFAIINHVNADSPPFRPEVIKSQPLRCDMYDGRNIMYRDKTRKVEGVLVDSFFAACKGDDERYKLVCVRFDKGRLTFAFADLETVSAFGSCEAEYIVFNEDSWINLIPFSITVERGMDLPLDKYEIRFFGGVQKYDASYHGVETASILRYSNRELRSKNYIMRRDGAYYLRQYKYD